MDCRQAKKLIIPYLLGDLEPKSWENLALEHHLKFCQACDAEYQNNECIVGFIEENKSRFAGAFESLEKRDNYCRVIWRISAAAACLVIGVFLCLFASDSRLNKGLNSNQQASALGGLVKIEILADSGNVIIPADRQIASGDSIKTLVINNRHRLIMNTDTTLTIQPLRTDELNGCIVDLAFGQIYAEIEHDGNPFVVKTPHGQAVITGTAFDINVTVDTTRLAVTKGAVRFESQNGVVNVVANQTSQIVTQFAPSNPTLCDIAEITAWVTNYKHIHTSAKVVSNTNEWYLALSLKKDIPILEKTDYESWVEEKREWFKENFPWIFLLKEDLSENGVEVDYPELLIKTGDIWQFKCLDVIPARFSVIDPNSILKIASTNGSKKTSLQENTSLSQYVRENQILISNNLSGQRAFERWLNYFIETDDKAPIPIYSYHASKYLANTRSLIWFAVSRGVYNLSEKERADVLSLLQQEVTIACQCQNDLLYAADEQKPSCDDDKYKTQIDSVTGYIKKMKALEESIMEYNLN